MLDDIRQDSELGEHGEASKKYPHQTDNSESLRPKEIPGEYQGGHCPQYLGRSVPAQTPGTAPDGNRGTARFGPPF
jgi:hypothetical protein